MIGSWFARTRETERLRDLGDAALVLAIGTALVAIGVVHTLGPVPERVDGSRWIFMLPLLAGCAVMLVKRRHPMLALLAGTVTFAVDASMGGSLGVLLAFFDLIYAAALFADTRWVRRLEVTVAVVVPAAAIAVFIASGELQQSVVLGLLVFATLGTPLWWGRSVRQQTALAELAAARARDLETLAELREEEVVRDERTRMAHDLHDTLAGQLSTIAIHAEGLLTVPTDDDARRDQGLRAIRAASLAALQEMRSMIGLLRTGQESRSAPARLGELDALAARLRAQGLALRTEVAPLPTLPSATDQAAYRIVQEALTNELKHGAGGEASVRIRAEDHRLLLEVTGGLASRPPSVPPPPTGTSAGTGLVTMRERAEALGGSFQAGWQPATRRWRVRATIPTTTTTATASTTASQEETR